MEFKSIHYSIDSLLQKIRTSKMALPDFQRDFVWNPSKVVELLDSVARQWPIGSLLLLKGPQTFAIREINSGPTVTGKELEIYVLDGQQRITSLYHAINDVSDVCYFIRFNSLINGEDEYISWEKRDRFKKLYPTIESRAKEGIALIKEIWDLEAFYIWLENIESSSKRIEIVSIKERRLAGLQTQVYKLFATELEREIELEALARIFETLNRTGVRLNAVDLMVASLYPSGFRLRDEWDKAKESFSAIERLNADPIEVLKLIALLIRNKHGKQASAGVRQGDLLNIERNLISSTWSEAVSLYSEALEYCENNFGIISGDLVPSWSMILGIAGWLNIAERDDLRIRKWWINRLFTNHFAQAANTRIVTDFELITFHPEELNLEPPSSFEVLQESAKRNGLLSKGVAGLLIKQGAIDIKTNTTFDANTKTALRSITEGGVITRITSEASINSIFVVSEQSDKMLGKEASMEKFHIQEFLERQGFNASIHRDDAFWKSTIDNMLSKGDLI